MCIWKVYVLSPTLWQYLIWSNSEWKERRTFLPAIGFQWQLELLSLGTQWQEWGALPASSLQSPCLNVVYWLKLANFRIVFNSIFQYRSWEAREKAVLVSLSSVIKSSISLPSAKSPSSVSDLWQLQKLYWATSQMETVKEARNKYII